MLRNTLAALILAAALPALALPLHTARGDVEIAEPPATLAVYDPGVIDALHALGVSVAAAPDFKSEFTANAKTVGTLFEPDLEALAAVKPDLIVVAQRSAKKLEDVSRVGTAVDLTFDPAKNAYDQTLARVENLGEVFGKQAEAKAVIDKLNALRDETKALAENQGKILAVLTNGPKLSIYGKQSRIGWIEDTLGVDLLDKEKTGDGHGNPISYEFIAESNPDWIFVIDRAAAIGAEDLQPAEKTLDTPLVQNTNAGKNGRIVYLNPRNIYISVGGPQAIEGTLIEIRDAFKAKGGK